MHGWPPYYFSAQVWKWHYSLSKHLFKKSDMNGWTHSSFWWLWFTCNSLTSAHTHSFVISYLLSLQNVRTKEREVVFISVHCIALSNLPWALVQERKVWVSTCIKDPLEWFDYLCASLTLSPSQTVRQCVYSTDQRSENKTSSTPNPNPQSASIYSQLHFSDFHATW